MSCTQRTPDRTMVVLHRLDPCGCLLCLYFEQLRSVATMSVEVLALSGTILALMSIGLFFLIVGK